MMRSVLLLFLLTCVAEICAEKHTINKRLLPTNEKCDPDLGNCRRGDWIAEHIAECEHDSSILDITCDVQHHSLLSHLSWIVDVAVGDSCKPVSHKGTGFVCGTAGTNTRCVCSDYRIFIDECKCQYWPPEDSRASLPSFCTGYYTGGTSGVHHWACCNSCNDPDTNNACASMNKTWQGGSDESYCGRCGENTGGGLEKYSFSCGSCSDQETCANTCNGFRSIPGFCWNWLDCFKRCCEDESRAPISVSFCGDGICSNNEKSTSCPLDCCYQVNDMCSTALNQCAPECCQSPSCCGKRE